MNPILGDREIEIGGKKYVAKPTFKSLMIIEAGTTSLAEILASFGNRKPKATDMVLVIHSCISSHDPSCPDFEALGALIHKDGFDKFVSVSVELAAAIWSGAQNEKKTQ